MIDKLKDLVNNFDQNLEFYKNTNNNYNETETRNEYIDVFFSLLGWDLNNKGKKPELREVMVERQAENQKRPDYTFTLNGVKKFFVEAKKPVVDLTSNSNPAFQARSYGWSARHSIVVLTNFEYLFIYDATVKPKVDDNVNTALLKKYHYNDYIENWDEIKTYLSRETVYSGGFDKQFDKLLDNREKILVDEDFLNQINEWRLDLADYLYNEYPDYSIEKVNDLVQEFINQIVFLRICEDRNLPLYHRLQDALDDEKKIKSGLTSIFKFADKQYNSGIFNGENIIFDLSNDIIMNMIKTLYYPQSPYMFNTIESNLLGEIYEMFLAEKIVLENGEVRLKKKEENENRDIVTTPPKIVKYMVQDTLQPVCNGKTPEEILDLNIADISCGSGIFLLETFNYLIKYCKNWYIENNSDVLIEEKNNEYRLPFKKKKEILVSCIYGVDIDAHAVEVAQFSLLLKLLESETKPSLKNKKMVLPELKDNIKVGNALIDFDHIEYYERYYDEINREDKNKIVPFDWNFANDVSEFDVLIGNPPYVTTEGLNNIIPEQELKVYNKKYDSSHRQFDKYFLFIERSLNKLNDDGVMCYIVPPKFSKIISGKKIRRLITDNDYLSKFINFGSMQLFKEKTIYSSILKLNKNSQDEFIYEKADNFEDLNDWWLNKQKDDPREQKRVFNKNVIDEDPWVLISDKQKADLFDLMYENNEKLGDLAEVTNGIQTSADDVYLFHKDEIEETIYEDFDSFQTNEKMLKQDRVAENREKYIKTNDSGKYKSSNKEFINRVEGYKIEKNNKYYTIEKEILKPFYKVKKEEEKGKSSYDNVQANSFLIFPYDDEGNLYSEEEMKNRFSGCWEYLKDHKERLENRSISGGQGVWYQFGRTQNLTTFINTDKLVAGVMTKYPFYYYDTNDWFLATGGTAGNAAIIKKEDSPYELEYIQAILTHPVITWLLDTIGSAFESDYRAKGTSILERVPIKKIDFDNSQQVEKYNTIVDLSNKIYDINDLLKDKAITKKRETNLLREKEHYINKIQNQIIDLYGIEDELLDKIDNY